MKEYPPLFSWRSLRLRICLLLSIIFFLTACMRINMSLGITCMVNATAFLDSRAVTNSTPALSNRCNFNHNSIDEKAKGYGGSLLWSNSMSSMILGAPFYGQILTVTFSGYLVDRYGPKICLFGAAINAMVATVIGPFLATRSFWGFWCSRAMLGVGQTFVFPGCNAIAAKWFPDNERASVGAIYTSGIQIAAGLTSFIVAEFCTSSLGWPAAFYSFACCGFVWLILWHVFATDSPRVNTWVSPEEKQFLADKNDTSKHSHYFKSNTMPWRNILCGRAPLAIYVTQFSFGYSSILMQSFLPLFLKETFFLEIHQNGLITLTPFLSQAIFKNILAPCSDYFKKREYFDATNMSKTFQIFSGFGMAVALLGVIWIPNCDQNWIIVLFLALYGLSFAASIPGQLTSLLTIAPIYTGTITSVSMAYLTIAGVLLSQIISLIEFMNWPYKWPIVFFIGTALNVSTAIFFAFFAEVRIQSWAQKDDDSPEAVDLAAV